MKKTRIFLLAATMLVATVGVFATGTKFFTDDTPQNVYFSVDNGSAKTQLVGSSITALTLVANPSTSTTVADIIGANHTYHLYTNTGGSSYSRLYADF